MAANAPDTNPKDLRSGKLTYRLQRDHRDIVVSFGANAGEHQSRVDELLGRKLKAGFLEALDCVKQAFFPHVENNACPWKVHDAYAQLPKPLSGANSENAETSGEAEATKARGEDPIVKHGLTANTIQDLVRKARKPWPLAWQWKALFTAMPRVFRNSTSDGGSILTKYAGVRGIDWRQLNVKVRTAQIRQWGLVLIYTEDVQKAKDGLFVPRRVLLRPPLFGESDRLCAWDHYFTLLNFQNDIANAWKDAARLQAAGSTSYATQHAHDERVYVLGRHDVVYTMKLGDVTFKGTVGKELAFQLTPELDLHPYVAENWQVAKRAIKLGFLAEQSSEGESGKANGNSSKNTAGRGRDTEADDATEEPLSCPTEEQAVWRMPPAGQDPVNTVKLKSRDKASGKKKDIKLYPESWEKREDQLRIQYPYDYVSIPVSQTSSGSEDPVDQYASYMVDESDKKTRKASGKLQTPEFEALDEEVVLLASDAMCRAYESLAEVWNDRTAKSVLIIAPPGSGKEVLARSVHCFQSNVRGRYVTYALSPSSHEQNDRVLFGRDLDTLLERNWTQALAGAKYPAGKQYLQETMEEQVKSLLLDLTEAYLETRHWATEGGEPSWTDVGVEDVEGLGKIFLTPKECERQLRRTCVPHHVISDGLLFQARGGALLLDEIDKVPEQTRASLLRLLENDEFAIYNTSIVVRLDEWRPTYIFAGSRPRVEMYNMGPRDFWTRISHVVEVKHPLDVDAKVDRCRIARSYFRFFWAEHLPKFFERANLLPVKFMPDEAPFFEGYYGELYTLLNEVSVLESVADWFAEEVDGRAATARVSARDTRSIVGRVMYGLVDHLIYDKQHDSALVRIRRERQADVVPAKDIGWFGLLGSLIDGSAGKAEQTGDEETTPDKTQQAARGSEEDTTQKAESAGQAPDEVPQAEQESVDDPKEKAEGEGKARGKTLREIEHAHGELFRRELREIVRSAIRLVGS